VKTRYEYIHFVLLERERGKKTDIWRICNNKSGATLGYIKWHPPWRQYCLVTMHPAVFNRGCLDNIKEFITEAMEERKDGR
jgi:hypothetical protein